MSAFAIERQFATRVVAEACEIARRVQNEITATGDAMTKTDRSPVTIADLAIQTVVSRRLANRFPCDPLLAEEDVSPLEDSPATTERVLDLAASAIPDLDPSGLMEALGRGGHSGGATRHWVLDPIDGTKGFLRGEQYAVALALVHEGQVVVGVLGCPNLGSDDLSPGRSGGTIYGAEQGCGTTMTTLGTGAEGPITVDRITDSSSARFCESVESAHADHSEQARIAARLGISLPSVRIDSQCKYAVVARGGASIYLRLPRDKTYREKVWDHAAGVLVIEEAEGRVSDLDGRPLDFSEGRYLARSHGIIATNGHLHDKVLATCRDVLGL
jgi:3'(2'), 5'-bisphosphate nucleotidase